MLQWSFNDNVRTPFQTLAPKPFFFVASSHPSQVTMRATGPLLWAGISANTELAGRRSDRRRVGDLFA